MPSKTSYLSKNELATYQRMVAQHGPLVEAQGLFTTYARERGGLTLDVWRLSNGPWFGEPQMMNLEAVAETLRVPYSDVVQVLQETHAAISAQLRALRPQLAEVNRKTQAYGRKHHLPH